MTKKQQITSDIFYWRDSTEVNACGFFQDSNVFCNQQLFMPTNVRSYLIKIIKL